MKASLTLVLIKCAPLLLLLATLCVQLSASAQGTAFTYQGRLNDGASPASGIYDLRFAIYDLLTAGTQQGGMLTNTAVSVSNGLFVVRLDFGNQFPGANRFLEIGVRTNGGGGFTTLSPRQALTPSPYAITAENLISGGLAAGTYSNAVSFNNPANSFIGNGTGLTNVNATSVGGLAASNFWNIAGNSGTSPTSGKFLGTLDNQPLELKVNGQRALRLEPNASGTPNVIGGSANNTLDAGLVATTIGGGDQNIIRAGADNSTIGGGYANTIGTNSNWSTISGGVVNGIGNDSGGSTIAGGNNQFIDASTLQATISGGLLNTIQSNAQYSVIAGGGDNTIGAGSYSSIISGGDQNKIGTNSYSSIIAGGHGNLIGANARMSGIVAGNGNLIEGDAVIATISGGNYNDIQTAAFLSIIAGGALNVIGTNAYQSAIGGGVLNVIGTNAYLSTIGGGDQNAIGANANWSTIAGGHGNSIGSNANWSTIAGVANQIQDRAGGSTISGGNNQVIQLSAIQSTIGGGVLNSIGTSAYQSAIAGGANNVIGANAYQSTIGGGTANLIGTYAFQSTIAGGAMNVISSNATSATIGGGYQNAIQTNAQFATIPGGLQAQAISYGQQAYASGQFVTNGDAQSSLYVLRASTTGLVTNEMFLDGAGKRMKVPANGTWTFDILLTAHNNGVSSAGYHFTGVIENLGGGFIGFVGTPVKVVLAEDFAGWDANIVADTVNNALTINVTGSNGTTVRWVASVRTAEVIN